MDEDSPPPFFFMPSTLLFLVYSSLPLFQVPPPLGLVRENPVIFWPLPPQKVPTLPPPVPFFPVCLRILRHFSGFFLYQPTVRLETFSSPPPTRNSWALQPFGSLSFLRPLFPNNPFTNILSLLFGKEVPVLRRDPRTYENLPRLCFLLILFFPTFTAASIPALRPSCLSIMISPPPAS